MTPEELDGIKDIGARYGAVSPTVVETMADEIRRLWAERDARRLAGQPVSEERLAGIRQNIRRNPSTAGLWLCKDVLDLLQHIAFLERLLADADDLPRVRATGYADGWRAGVGAAAELVEGAGLLSNLARRARALAEGGPQ